MKLLDDIKSRKTSHADNTNLIGGPGDRIIDGWIQKEGATTLSRAKDRWFILEKGLLHYTEDKQCLNTLGTIYLWHCIFQKEDSLLSATLRTSLSLTVKNACIELHRDRSYRLLFHSTHDLKDWTRAIDEQISLNKDIPVIRKVLIIVILVLNNKPPKRRRDIWKNVVM